MIVPIVSCHGFEPTEAIVEKINESCKTLESRLDAIAMTATLSQEAPKQFRVNIDFKGAHGESFNATAQGEDVYALIKEATKKLSRQITGQRQKQSGKNQRDRLDMAERDSSIEADDKIDFDDNYVDAVA